MFLLVLGGCGYKADPYYNDEVKKDNSVKFIVKDINNSRELK